MHPDLKLVGLLNQTTLRKQTVAFASRFDRLVRAPALEAVHDPVAEVKTAGPNESTGTVIDLHHASTWREALLPHYGLDAQGEVQELPGRWDAAVATGKPIELRNAPVDDPHFRDALRALLVAHPQTAVRCTQPSNIKKISTN